MAVRAPKTVPGKPASGNGSGSYSAADIQVLEGLKAVRRRPSMYIGTTDLRGLHLLVREVLDNSIDEAMNGTCDRIDLWIHKTNEIIFFFQAEDGIRDLTVTGVQTCALPI